MYGLFEEGNLHCRRQTLGLDWTGLQSTKIGLYSSGTTSYGATKPGLRPALIDVSFVQGLVGLRSCIWTTALQIDGSGRLAGCFGAV